MALIACALLVQLPYMSTVSTSSVSRLTLYAIISAVELDLRSLIAGHLAQHIDAKTLLGDDLYARVSSRYKRDLDLTEANETLAIIDYLDFGDSYALLNTHGSSLPESIRKGLKAAARDLESLAPIRNRVMHSRPLEHDDLVKALAVADKVALNMELPWQNLKDSLFKLETNPSFVLTLSLPAITKTDTEKPHNLPTPDFDETGFIGRRTHVDAIKQHCLGPYPVVTLIGDGGVGKTALALKVAYELLDDPRNPFDALVWTSSKTTQLTSTEVQRIEGAICDSLGVFKSIEGFLGSGATADPVEEVLAYLREFKILLILDNLETVLDERVRLFLQHLPLGSKVFITSRIGVGAFEFPYRLEAMTNSEAVQLLRATAVARNVSVLSKASGPVLSNYLKRLNNNAGFIKWFVSAVQAGVRPEAALADPTHFLRFCMSNVYGYLSEDAKTIIRTMLCQPGQHTLATLAFLSNLSATRSQDALHELMRTSMIVMTSRPAGSAIETTYELSDLARTYLSKIAPASNEEQLAIRYRKTQLSLAAEKLKISFSGNPYNAKNLSIRSKNDIVVAKILMDALDAGQHSDFVESERLLEQARALSPDYFEVYRVEAWIHYLQGQIPAARSSYEAAVELEPRSAPLRYWFAGFLMRFYDAEEAETHLQLALGLEPDGIEIRIELTRAYMFLHRYPEARALLDVLLELAGLHPFLQRKLLDINLQFYIRIAEQFLSERLPGEAIQSLEKFKDAFVLIPERLRDEQMEEKVLRVVQIAKEARGSRATEEENWHANELIRWARGDSLIERPLGEFSGKVVRRPLGSDFGFLEGQSGELYFHKRALRDGRVWQQLKPGTPVRYDEGENPVGLCAINISLLEAKTDATPFETNLQ